MKEETKKDTRAGVHGDPYLAAAEAGYPQHLYARRRPIGTDGGTVGRRSGDLAVHSHAGRFVDSGNSRGP